MKLNDFEKWFFDLKGFFVIKNVVPKSDAMKMKKLAQSWFKSDMDLPERMLKDFERP